MKFSKKSRYGLRALIDLAVHAENSYISLSSIAERNDISPQYLEQVFASLRRAEIVKSVKGPQGGYLLKRNPEDITVSDILLALEGSYEVERDDGKDNDISGAIQSLIVDRINEEMTEILSGLSLEDLKEEYLRRSGGGQDMYYI